MPRDVEYFGIPIHLQALPGERHSHNRKMIGASYGYVVHTAHQGADNMALDVFLASHPRGDTAYVIDTANDDDVFQESKIMLGFPSAHAAVNVFRRTYGDDGDHHVAAITELSIPELKQWIEDGGGKEPASEGEPSDEQYQQGGAVDDDVQLFVEPIDWEGEAERALQRLASGGAVENFDHTHELFANSLRELGLTPSST